MTVSFSSLMCMSVVAVNRLRIPTEAVSRM